MDRAARKAGVGCYEFQGFVLDPLRRQLRRPGGSAVDLSARAFDALLYLVEHRGEDVGRDRLMQAVWPRTIVADNNVDQAISAVRRALGDTRSEPRFVLTIPGRGYRFIADVAVREPVAAATGEAESEGAAIASTPSGIARHELALAPGGSPNRVTRTLGAALLAIAVIGGALFAREAWRRTGEPPVVTAGASVAVLPFKPLLPGHGDPALELGMASTMIARLGALPGITVVPLSSVRRYASPDVDPRIAGTELGAETVLDGSLQRDADRLRVTVRLLRVRDGRALWTRDYEAPAAGILDVQDAIAQQVLAEIAPAFPPAGLPRRPTQNPAAYEHYVQGLHYWLMRPMGRHADAIRSFEAALEQDPGYAEAWSALSSVLAAAAVFGTQPPDRTFPRAKDAALRAVQLDPQLSSGWAALGHVLVQYERNYVAGNAYYERALALQARDAHAHMWRSINFVHLGRNAEAVEGMRNAQRLEPKTLVYTANLGYVLYLSRDYAGARGVLERLLDVEPRFDMARSYLARVLLQGGDTEGAWREVAARQGPAPGAFGDAGRVHAVAGRRSEAEQEIARLEELDRQGFGVAYDLATVHAALGDLAAACDALVRSLDDRSQMLGMLRADPAVDRLRDQPCYAPVYRRLYGAEPPPQRQGVNSR